MMKPPEKPSLDTVEKLLIALALVSLCLIAYVGGALSSHYRLRVIDPLVTAFEAGDAWLAEWSKKASGAVARGTLDEAVKNAKIYWDLKNTDDSYTLFTTWAGSAAYLVDRGGHIAHKWKMPFSKVWPNAHHIRRMIPDGQICWEAAYLYPNGDLLAIYIAISQTPYGFGMVKLDKNSRVIWSYAANTHHDMYVDKTNGNIYVLVQELTNEVIPGLENLHYPLMVDYVAILSPEGKELKRISLAKAFEGTPYEQLKYHWGNWDYFHSNSVAKLEPDMASAFPQFKAGQILVSIRNYGALAVIDPDSEKVVWASKGIWRGQHAAHFLDNGRILLLDNKGMIVAGDTRSRILELDPKTMGYGWSYSGDESHPFFTNIIGRVQRLETGNTMITEGTHGRIFEVTPEGKIVWDYTLPPLKKNVPQTAPPDDQENAKDAPPKKIVRQSAVVIASALRYQPSKLTFLKTKNESR